MKGDSENSEYLMPMNNTQNTVYANKVFKASLHGCSPIYISDLFEEKDIIYHLFTMVSKAIEV